MKYTAYVVDRAADGQPASQLQALDAPPLADGEVRIRVAYSSLNYKDALAARAHPGVVKSLPHVPGIDAAGVVAESNSPAAMAGQEVIATSYEIGAGRHGGWAEYLDVPGEWLVPLPPGLTLREAMILGTAGLTAATCVEELQRNEVLPREGDVLVTGASGGVGSLAVAILGQLGYRVTAVSGKPQQHEWLRRLGAAEILPREAVQSDSDRPLLSSRWAGAVDTVGGDTLATIVRSMHVDGCVAACGLVGGDRLPLTVHPFILRGVKLAGVSTANCGMPRRRRLWARLAGDWKPADLETFAREVPLDEVPATVEQILAGGVAGRTLVRID